MKNVLLNSDIFPNGLLFLPERMKIGKAGKLVANLYDKERIYCT